MAIVSPSTQPNADVDFLFVQVVLGENRVDTTPNCGNILAGVGPFAIETSLVQAKHDSTSVRVYMVNSGKICELVLCTPQGKMQYQGNEVIDGVAGSAAPIVCHYLDVSGAICGALLPTGNVVDHFENIAVTCIDNGMPVVLIKADDLAITGYETPEELDGNETLKMTLEAIRLQAGPKMNLGDVSNKAVPKMAIISPATKGGLINTRTFIPHKCHSSVGVLGAVTVASACLIPGSVAECLVTISANNPQRISVEHPSGSYDIALQVEYSGSLPSFTKAGVIRTARLLSRGELYVPSHQEISK